MIQKFLLLGGLLAASTMSQAAPRPNIFIAISDDQSWPHASAYGSTFVSTPTFDRLAREGVLFHNAFSASPGCSPSRASLLTGLNTWQLEHAGTHGSFFHPKFVTFPERLQAAGYFVGSTGKGWGPGDFRKLGREHNPAGPSFPGQTQRGKGGPYVEGFAAFLRARPADQPFCFWFGSHDPHRKYELGSGVAKGKSLTDVKTPSFLPDVPEIRSDLLDYACEIERFDDELARMITLLEAAGELENTLLIVTSDNGMPFPRAKANCYEYGIHMPLVIRWGDLPGGRYIEDLVGWTDLTATIYDIAGVAPPEQYPLEGKSLAPILKSDQSGVLDPTRTAVFSARERHSSSRFRTLGYPQRAIRTATHLYIRNFKPERSPAGPGQRFDSVSYARDGSLLKSKLSGLYDGYHDIDACPSLTFLTAGRDDPAIRYYLDLAVAHRPAVELFDIRKDPGCLHNLAGQAEAADVQTALETRLMDYLKQTGDARVLGNGDVWETYPRVGKMRWFPEPAWARDRPESVPQQPWLDERRPRG